MAEVIISPNNSTIKLIKSLRMKKYRDEYGLYLIEGQKIVEEALIKDGGIHTLVFSEKFDMQDIIPKIREKNIPIIRVSNGLFRQISNVKSPQGIIGIIRKNQNDIESMFCKGQGLWVVLDRIQDPGNMGTIIRTVDAAGGGGVILLKGCADPFNPKVIRSTMGSIFRVPIIFIEDDKVFFKRLTEDNAEILISALEGKNIFRWKGSDSRNLKVLVIGNESRGISLDIRKFSTGVLSIPIVGGAESLNASVAAGIMIYEIMRKTGNLEQEISCIP